MHRNLRMRPLLVGLALASLGTIRVASADEKVLRSRFEGREAVVRIDMPATRKGVDLQMDSPQPLDSREHDKRLRDNGVGVGRGRVAVLTRINVKKSHIEIQLGKGGDDQRPTHSPPTVAPSQAERNAKDDLKRATSDAERKKAQTEIDRLRDAREREQKHLRALYEIEYQAELARFTPEHWNLMAGSRFNLRYQKRVPPEVLTPQGLERALADYLDFSPAAVGRAKSAAGGAAPAPRAGSDAAGPGPLRKGMSMAEVRAKYGAPERCTDERQGDLDTQVCRFRAAGSRIEAYFVAGVLVRYTLSSE